MYSVSTGFFSPRSRAEISSGLEVNYSSILTSEFGDIRSSRSSIRAQETIYKHEKSSVFRQFFPSCTNNHAHTKMSLCDVGTEN
jgi:hypothetical protein